MKAKLAFYLVQCAFLALLAAAAAWGSSDRPVAVSPGESSFVAKIHQSCPTFSWAPVLVARGHELIIYAVQGDMESAAVEDLDMEQILLIDLPGMTSSWTPPSNQCLELGGTYAWSVRADRPEGETEWSEAKMFQVKAPPSQAEVAEALSVLRRFLNDGEQPRELGELLGWDTEEELPVKKAVSQRETAKVGMSFSVDGSGNVSAASFTGSGLGLTGVTAAGLNCTSCVDGSDIADNSVSSADINNETISSSDIGPNAVGSSEITNGSVLGLDIATGTITSTNIADGTVTGTDIANGTVGSSDVDASQVQLRVSGSCPSGQSIRVINSGGSVSCEVDTVVTSVNGLSGGGITSNVAVSGLLTATNSIVASQDLGAGRHIEASGGHITTGFPSVGFSDLDIASTDDIVADDLIQSSSGSIQASNGAITAFVGGSASLPNDGDGDAGDVNAADDLRAGDDVLAFGTKSAVVKTLAFGTRRFYADESTEVYFFDRGRGQLTDGEAFIPLDPIFQSSVSISPKDPLLVQITLTSNCTGVFVERADDGGFLVKELGEGKSQATFNWEVGARRRDYERTRLEAVDIGVLKTATDAGQD